MLLRVAYFCCFLSFFLIFWRCFLLRFFDVFAPFYPIYCVFLALNSSPFFAAFSPAGRIFSFFWCFFLQSFAHAFCLNSVLFASSLPPTLGSHCSRLLLGLIFQGPSQGVRERPKSVPKVVLRHPRAVPTESPKRCSRAPKMAFKRVLEALLESLLGI